MMSKEGIPNKGVVAVLAVLVIIEGIMFYSWNLTETLLSAGAGVEANPIQAALLSNFALEMVVHVGAVIILGVAAMVLLFSKVPHRYLLVSVFLGVWVVGFTFDAYHDYVVLMTYQHFIAARLGVGTL